MLPEIKTRLNTQDLCKRNQKSLSLINRKPFVRHSVIHACLPYLEELKHKSVNISPQKVHKKKRRRQILKAEATPKNINSLQRIHQIPEEIQSEDKSTSNTIEGNNLHSFNLKGHSSKISCLIKYLDKVKQKDLSSSELRLKNSRPLKIYSQCEQQLQKLPNDKFQWNHSTVQSFIGALTLINPFFKKLSKVVNLCLLKVGKIRIFSQQEIIQIENDRVKRMGIVLWGEVLLKNNQNKLKIYLFAGDSLNQELVLSESSQNPTQVYYVKKGTVVSQQTAKAKIRTAILFLKLEEYKMIYDQLAKIGEKNQILKAQNMIKRSFAKKKNFRKEFSYL